MILVLAVAEKNSKNVAVGNAKMKKIPVKILLSFISGLLMFLSFPPIGFAFLGWICVVPLFFVVKNSSSKEAFLYSYFSGIIFYSALLSWLVNVTIPGAIIIVAILAIFHGLFGLVTRYVFKYSMDMLILPFVWVVLEYIRSNLFTGFPWGLLGYLQYKNINLIQISDFTGAYGVSFLLVAFNVAMYAWISKHKRKISYMAIALIFMLASNLYSVYKFNNYLLNRGPSISIVQGSIPQRFKWDPKVAEDILNTYEKLTLEASKESPDMIVWPETSYPYLVRKENMPEEEIVSIAQKTNIPILAGFVLEDGGVNFNSVAFFEKPGKEIDVYRKTHLVPFGEYIPFERQLSIIRGLVDKPIGNYSPGEKYTLFKVKSEYSFDDKEVSIMKQIYFNKFGVLICFEDVFPYISRNFVKKGADFLVNITNDAWFEDTAASSQHLQASVFRAIENRVPVVRAANTGISCFIDSVGRISSTVESEGKTTFVEGFSTKEIYVYPGKSYYTVYGDFFIYFCGIMIIILFFTETFFIKKK